MTIKEIKAALKVPGTKFKVTSLSSHRRNDIFVMGDGYVKDDRIFGNQMNIGYFGSTKMDLYTFDMLGKKSTGTIHFKDVEIVK